MTRYTRFSKGPTPEQGKTDSVASRFSRGSADARLPAEPTNVSDDQRNAPSRNTVATTVSSGSKPVITLFLVTLIIPIEFLLGTLQLTANRLVLLALVVPMLIKWASGQAGKIYGLDFVFLFYVFWMGVTLFIAHGTFVIDLVGITFVEAVGAFMIGRVFVRTPDDFERVMDVLYYIMLGLLPAAVLESLTGIRIYTAIADIIGSSSNWLHDGGVAHKRMGMFRAHTVFEHPILFGTFSASIFGLLYFGRRPNHGGLSKYRRAFLSVAGTFFSLSSGAVISLIAQIGMASWDSIFQSIKHHWWILLALVVSAWVAVDLASNRTPFEVFITYAAFSAHNGYTRILIFNYGMENVWANPIFGIGHGHWFRPHWLKSASVDNFWLLMALRHGFLGFILIAWAFLATILRLSRLKISNPRVRAMRLGIVFALIGLSLSLMTVHVWGVTYVFVCFLLGTGLWMREYAGQEGQDGADQSEPDPSADTERRGPPGH